MKGKGNSINYKYRMHDPRIGRFFAVDPLAGTFPHNSPYAFSENKVIAFVELEGAESIEFHSVTFAPYESFGGGFGGDGEDRKFGDALKNDVPNKEFNYRTYSAVNVDLNTMDVTESTLGQTWSYKVGKNKNTGNWSDTWFVTDPSFGGQGDDGWSPRETSEISNQNYLYWHSRGIDKASGAALTANKLITDFGSIDVKHTIAIGKPRNEENDMTSVSINGIVNGDRFPSHELYITDKAGNKVMLGVSAVDSDWPLAPQRMLPGTGSKSMSDFHLLVFFNKDGTFHHVEGSDGSQYNIDAWNEKFTGLDPKNPDVGTKTNGGQVQTDHHDYHPSGFDNFMNVITAGTWKITYWHKLKWY